MARELSRLLEGRQICSCATRKIRCATSLWASLRRACLGIIREYYHYSSAFQEREGPETERAKTLRRDVYLTTRFHNFVSPIISAIFSGNGILVKPSEQTCWSSIYFTDIIRGVLRICGHDKDLVQTVVCLPEVAEHLTSHPNISHITFIGSREIAYKVCASAAKALTPVTVELGGKDPAIVLDDDTTIDRLEETAAILMRGVFQSAGQNCIGIERVIALPGVYDRLIMIIVSKIERMVLGSVLLDEMGHQSSEQVGTPRVFAKDDPRSTQERDVSSERKRNSRAPMPPRIELASGSSWSSSGRSILIFSQQHAVSKQPTRSSFDFITPDMGAMISPARFAQLEELITAAVRSGATLHTGGRRYHHPRYPKGHYFMPTLLSGVHPGMAIARTELFAPIFLLMKAKDVDEAIAMSNSTPYALGASVFGHSRKDVQRCVKEIKAGMVAVNDFGAYYACSLPFGGLKGSGYGRFGGEEGLRGLCNVKAVCEDAWWARLLRIRTRIPARLQYPIGNGREGWNMCLGLIRLGYGLGFRAKVGGLLLLVAAHLGFTPKAMHQWCSIGTSWNSGPFLAEDGDEPRRSNGRQQDEKDILSRGDIIGGVGRLDAKLSNSEEGLGTEGAKAKAMAQYPYSWDHQMERMSRGSRGSYEDEDVDELMEKIAKSEAH